MDFEALHSANFKLLDDTVGDWTKVLTRLEALKGDAKDGLQGKANKANWSGYNATVSREFINKTAGEFNDAYMQAKSIGNIVRDTCSELKTQQRLLKEAMERGRGNNISVKSDGSGFTVTPNPDKAPANGQKDVDGLRDELQGILNKATEIDSTAATTLKALVDLTEHGFSGADYADRDSAAKAVKEAEQAAKILKKNPHDVTATELNQLNGTLAKYKNDPLFAERFALDVGPKKTLEFYAGIADPYQGYGYDPKRAEQAKQLQKNLGITLGTATRSDSAQMERWEYDMVNLGPHNLGIDDANDPRGFSVMSNLMRFGDYDDQFLNEYGNELISFDKERNVKDMSPWINNYNQGDLNFWGKNDRGRDPMTGFLEALGHNPGASTDFFSQPGAATGGVTKDDQVNENLNYLTKDRIWLSDAPMMGGDDKVVAGRDALGHALEAAATGHAWDGTQMSGKDPMVPGAGDLRTPETAGVMEQVAYLYGSEDGPKMLHEQPELADSLGKMGAAYIDDINYGLSGIGDEGKDAGDFPAKYAERAQFGEQGAISFLSVLGQNETSHGIVTTAEHLYTLSLLDANPPTSDANIDHARDALAMEAESRGILDHSRVQQAELTYTAESEEANKSLGRSAEWGKYAVGAVVAGGVAAVPVPGSAGVAFAIAPIATEMAGEALNTFIGQQIDKGVDGSQDDPREKSQVTSTEFYSAGATSIGSSYRAYTDLYPEMATQVDEGNWTQSIKGGYYGTGSNENDYRGRPAYKED